MVKQTVSKAIANWDSLNPILATVLEYISDPTKKWLVVCNPDWSAIWPFLKLDQTTPQTLTASPIINNLTAGRIPFVNTDKSLTDSSLFSDDTKLGIRTDDFSKTFNIYGNVNFTIQDSSGTIASLANDGAGNLGNGKYRYAIIFVTDEGETGGYSPDRSNVVEIVDNTTNGKVLLTNIPLGNSYTTARKIYRTVVNGNQSLLYYLDTINDNTTTEYLDNIADSGLKTSDGWYRKPDETTGGFYLNGKKSLETSEFNTFFGNLAGGRITSGHSSTFIGAQAGRDTTTGQSNNFIGYSSGVTITTGSNNNFMGYASGYFLRNCFSNVAIGDTALRAANILDNVSYNTCLGTQTLYNFKYAPRHNIAIGYRCGRGIGQTGTAIGNILIGSDTAYNTLDNGNYNILIGHGVYTPTTSTSNYLNIGGLITGNMSGSKYLSVDGNVGIWTTAPTEKLHVLGNLFIDTDSGELLLWAWKDMSISYDWTDWYIKTNKIVPSDLHITTWTAKTIVYDTPVWEDLNFAVVRSWWPVATRPDDVTINNCYYKEFTSANNQTCWDAQEIYHQAMLWRSLYPHAHIFLKSGESSWTTWVTFTIYWELRQSTWVTNWSVTVSATSAELASTEWWYILTLYDSSFTWPTELWAQLAMRLDRTWWDAGDVIVTTYWVHYEIDTPWSRTISSK